MNSPKVSVVLGTFNRGHLLERSLECYAKQTYPVHSLVILDDDSTDDTYKICDHYSDKVNIFYEKLKKPHGVQWRDSAAILNIGIKIAEVQGANFVVGTHPEVMPGPNSIQEIAASYKEDVYICCKPYYLTMTHQEILDQYPWKEIGAPAAVRQIPEFYEQAPPIAGHPDYRPITIDKTPAWDSWVFGGLSMTTWRKIGGMSEHNTWGTIDVTFHTRRRLLGIKNLTMKDMDSYCVHQNHDDPTKNIVSPRDMDVCMANVPLYKSPIEAICTHL